MKTIVTYILFAGIGFAVMFLQLYPGRRRFIFCSVHVNHPPSTLPGNVV